MTNRRSFLKGAGVAATSGLAGCSDLWNPLSVNIYQTPTLQNLAHVRGLDDDHAAKVSKNYVEAALEPVVGASDAWTHLDVSVIDEPVDVELDGLPVVLRAIEFDQWVKDHPGKTAAESNVLLDVGGVLPSSTVGLAFLFDGAGPRGCDEDDDDSDSAAVQYAERLLEIDPDEPVPDEIPVVDDKSLRMDYFPKFVASAVAHEVGHTLCSPHLYGNAWQGSDTPDRMLDDGPDEDTVYSSLMMHFYVLQYGGSINNYCGDPVEEFEYMTIHNGEDIVFLDDLSFLTRLSGCAAARIASESED